MRQVILPLFILLVLPFSLLAQNGGSALAQAGDGYVSVPDNANGSLDIGSGFTVEAWVYLMDSSPDQKVINKAGTDFTNAYVLGVEFGQLKFEVFDDLGEQTVLSAGTVPSGEWVHLAGTYTVDGEMEGFVNGVSVGTTPASSASHSYTLNDMAIGAASWDLTYARVNGQIEEVRYWQSVLDLATINDWMLRDLSDSHPNWTALTLYHKYNSGSGTDAVDSSPDAGNPGTLNGGADWAASTTPFEGDFDLAGDAVAGIWAGRTMDDLDIMTLEGSGLAGMQSVVFGGSGDYTFLTDAPDPYNNSMNLYWEVTAQGSPVADATFDLSPIDLSGFNTVVLLESDELNFENATVYTGTETGGVLSVPGITFQDGYYYTLGFGNITGTEDAVEATNEFLVSPNPSDGMFLVEWLLPEEEAELQILDLAGRVLYSRELGVQESVSVDLSDRATGLYLVQIRTQDGIYTQRITVQ